VAEGNAIEKKGDSKKVACYQTVPYSILGLPFWISPFGILTLKHFASGQKFRYPSLAFLFQAAVARPKSEVKGSWISSKAGKIGD